MVSEAKDKRPESNIIDFSVNEELLHTDPVG